MIKFPCKPIAFAALDCNLEAKVYAPVCHEMMRVIAGVRENTCNLIPSIGRKAYC